MVAFVLPNLFTMFCLVEVVVVLVVLVLLIAGLHASWVPGMALVANGKKRAPTS